MRGYGGMACAPYAAAGALALAWSVRPPQRPHGRGSPFALPVAQRPPSVLPAPLPSPQRPRLLRSLQPCPLRPSFSNMNLDS